MMLIVEDRIDKLTAKVGHRFKFGKDARFDYAMGMLTAHCACGYGVTYPCTTSHVNLDKLEVPSCKIDWSKTNNDRAKEAVNRVLLKLNINQEVTVVRAGNEWYHSFTGEGISGGAMLYSDLLSAIVLVENLGGEKVDRFFHIDKDGQTSAERPTLRQIA